MDFEWDEARNRTNIAKHGVSFATAKRIFDGFVVTATDERRSYGERREISIGRIDEAVLLTVVHTDRQGRRRIISARSASRKERQRYEQALQQGIERR